MSGTKDLTEKLECAINAIGDADWQKAPASVKSFVEAARECSLDALEQIQRLEIRVVELERENAALREQRNRNSSNSSMPPSTDMGKAKKKAGGKKGKGKRRGGQPGHFGYSRELTPSEQCKKVEDCYPTECRHCGAQLAGEDPDPYRHQVVDVPPVKAEVEEYRLHKLSCSDCGCETRAGVPEGVPIIGYSDRVVARVALLSGIYRASERMTQAAMQDFWGVEMSLGTVNQLRQKASAAVEQPVEEAYEYVQTQPVVQADETGFRQGNADGNNPSNRKGWLWVAVTTMVTVFRVSLSRGQDAAKALLSEMFSGTLVSDRWNGYNWVPLYARQLCWAHLKREFQKIAERGELCGQIGEKLLELEARLFQFWHQARDGTLPRLSFKNEAESIRRQMKILLEQGADYSLKKGDKSLRAKTARTCRDLLKVEPAMWLFVYKEGIPPTNNAAEKAIRPAVLWRNVSFGTQSENGSRFVARMLTVVTTLRLQNRNVLEFLQDACSAHRLGLPTPSLLPMQCSPELLKAEAA